MRPRHALYVRGMYGRCLVYKPYILIPSRMDTALQLKTLKGSSEREQPEQCEKSIQYHAASLAVSFAGATKAVVLVGSFDISQYWHPRTVATSKMLR